MSKTLVIASFANHVGAIAHLRNKTGFLLWLKSPPEVARRRRSALVSQTIAARLRPAFASAVVRMQPAPSLAITVLVNLAGRGRSRRRFRLTDLLSKLTKFSYLFKEILDCTANVWLGFGKADFLSHRYTLQQTQRDQTTTRY